MTLRLLDLFCGAGGCAVGYRRAGFTVVGVDLAPQPRYPFEFHQCDPLDFLRRHGGDFDAIHASPPCQAYSRLGSIHRFRKKKHPKLIDSIEELLNRIGVPWVIENVPGSNLDTHICLCGSMFGLGAQCDGKFHQLRRHRFFKTNFFFLMPLSCHHLGRPIGVYGNGGAHRKKKDAPGINGFTGNAQERREAMGIDWMNRYELSQAIPPAYTAFIGERLKDRVLAMRAAETAPAGSEAKS